MLNYLVAQGFYPLRNNMSKSTLIFSITSLPRDVIEKYIHSLQEEGGLPVQRCIDRCQIYVGSDQVDAEIDVGKSIVRDMSSEALSTRKRDDVDKGLLSMHCSSMVNTLAIGNYRCLLTSSQIPYCRCRQVCWHCLVCSVGSVI